MHAGELHGGIHRQATGNRHAARRPTGDCFGGLPGAGPGTEGGWSRGYRHHPVRDRSPGDQGTRGGPAHLGEWGLAAKAADLDAYYEHYGKGYDLVVADSTVTARKALGLATTPPDYEGGEGGGDDPGVEV